MKLKITLLLSLLLVITSCSKEEDDVLEQTNLNADTEILLKADFNFDTDVVNESEAIYITNLSKGVNAYHWDFGNGEVSAEQVPDLKLLSHGFYDVTLTVTNGSGKEDSITKTIEVLCLFGGGDHSTEEAEF